MYVRRSLQSKIRSLVVSHGFGSGFSSEFSWTGTCSRHVYLNFYTNFNTARIAGQQSILGTAYRYCCIECGLVRFSSLLSVLDFWEHYGIERIRSYIHATAKQAGRHSKNHFIVSFVL